MTDAEPGSPEGGSGRPAETAAERPAPETGVQGVRSGLRWSSISAFVLRLSNFLVGMITARLVAPSQFGAFAVAVTVYSVVAFISDMGISQAIPREVGRTHLIAPTATSIQVGSSFVGAGLLVALAPWLAGILGAPEATDAVRVLGLTLVAGAIGTVPAMILARDYRQRERFLGDATGFVISTGLLIFLAVNGWGVMALAWSRFIGQLAGSLVIIILNKERYGFGWDRAEVGPLLRFSVPLAGSSALLVAIANVDTVVVSRLMGSTDLGFYNQAFNIANWPIAWFSSILVTLTVPTFARALDDLPELREHVRAAMSLLAAAAFPLAAVLTVLAEPVVVVLYGERWRPAAPVLSVLGLLTGVRLIQVLFNDLLIALGETRAMLLAQAIWLVALVPAMVVGVSAGGIVGAAWVHVAVGVVVVIPTFLVIVRRRARLGASWARGSLPRPALGSVGAGVAAWAVAQWMSQPLTALVVGSLAAGAVYLALTWTWMRPLLGWLGARYRT